MTTKVPKVVLGYWSTMAILILSIIVVSWVFETQDLGLAPRILLALVPPITFAFMCFFMVRVIQLTDEMQRRILLEALAFAYPGVAFAIYACEYLRKAGFMSALKPDWVLAIMFAFGVIGYLGARRRYQ